MATSKTLGIGSAECSWGDIRTIKSGKISAHVSGISEKHTIVYTYDCIEEAIFGRTLSHIDSKTVSRNHSYNDENHAFDYTLYQWGVEKLFHNSDEVIIIELKFYIEDWGNCISITRANYCVSCFVHNMVLWICMMKIRRKQYH